MDQPLTARRAFIGSVGLLATSAVAPALAITMRAQRTDRQAWDTAYQAFDAARLADEHINALYMASTPARRDELDDEWNTRGDQLFEAEWILFDTPAPDLQALDWKLDILSKRGLVFEGDLSDTIIADVRRLKEVRA